MVIFAELVQWHLKGDVVLRKAGISAREGWTSLESAKLI